MADPEKTKFTMARAAAIKPPTDRERQYHYDAEVPGLALCVTAKGARVWYWYARAQGRPHRERIGRFPAINVDKARQVARQITGRVAEGKDPGTDRKRIRTDTTLLQAFELFRDAPSVKTKRPKRPATLAGYDTHFNEPTPTPEGDQDQQGDKRHVRPKGGPLHPWRSRKLSEIRQADVAKLHAKVTTERGAYLANRVLALLSAIFEHARRQGYPGENPARGIDRNAERGRMRYLRRDEMPAFLAALDDLPNQTTADALKLCLFTGARSSNVCAMRWDQIDMKGGTWNVPGEQMKNGDPLIVRLDPRALEVVKARQGNGSPWVFPSHGSSGHVTELKAALASACRKAGITDKLRVHDLRHTLASWMAANGVSLQIIGRQLGHRDPVTTAKYAHVDLEPVTAALSGALDAMTGQEKPTRDDKPAGRSRGTKGRSKRSAGK